MKTIVLILLILLVSLPAWALMLLQDTPVSDLRFVSSNPDQGTAVVRDIAHGQELQIAVGDVVGFDQAEVTAIKKNEIHLELGYELIKLRRLPGENSFTIIQRDPGN